MNKPAIIIATIALVGAVAASGAVGQASAPPAPPAPAAAQPATPAGTGEAPSLFPRAEKVLRPIPSILPTLRLIDSQMVSTLGFVLNLTAEQKGKVQDLLIKSDSEQKPKIEAQVAASEAYVGLLAKPDATAADLTAAADKVLKLDADIMAVRISALAGLKAILTPEQNKKLAESLYVAASRWLPRKESPADTPTPGNTAAPAVPGK